jgi:phosphoenolpyruvate carboxykinase (ATP)
MSEDILSAEEQVEVLLSGTEPQTVSAEVAEFNKYSRSNYEARFEDIKQIERDILINASPAKLVEQALLVKGSVLVDSGALAVRSGAKTGRSPKDKRVVDEPGSTNNVWWGRVNVKLTENAYMINRERAIDYLNTQQQIYVIDGYAGWDSRYRVRVRVICALAYHALFMRNMLVMPEELPAEERETGTFVPHFTILNAGGFPANRYVEGMTSSCSVDLHLGRMEMVILGTQYAGEMKKGILTLVMYTMPLAGQLPLHSSCNEDEDGNVTLFFGLSGTGKTTLSADPRRNLIGDDEHVWTEEGVFNVEGGCYAKCINLSAENEPEIFGAIRFGAVLENVIVDPLTRAVDYDDTSITQNTRCAYPLTFIPNAKSPATGGHPKNVVLLTCDAFGVLPPISKLTPEQVVYHFISGYTSKTAGTEMGVTKPVAAFSACYGEPFLVWHPIKYGTMLADRLQHHGANAWLINTGWVGGLTKGHRCPLKYTRAIIDAIHSGALADTPVEAEPYFGLLYPTKVPGVPDALLNPASSWDDKKDFEATSKELAGLFLKNFEQYKDAVPASVTAAGPGGK